MLDSLPWRWTRAARSTDLGLWWLADDVRAELPGEPEERVIETTLRLVKPLVENGQLNIGRVHRSGLFQRWEGPPPSWLERLAAEWRALGRPPGIGEIAWFTQRLQ